MVKHDLRLTLTIDALPLRHGHSATASLTVTNLGGTDVHWSSGNCAQNARFFVRPAGAFEGRTDQPGLLGRFKRMVLAHGGSGNVPYPFEFRRWVPGAAGGIAYGCLLHPGESQTEARRWSGLDGFVLPDVPLVIDAEFPFAWRGNVDPGVPEKRLSVTIASTYRGKVAKHPRLLLGPAVDAALTDPTFVDWLEASDPKLWANPGLHYDGKVWTIGLYGGSGPFYGAVRVDAITGVVLGTEFQ